MPDDFYAQPVLNSPYAYPARHWRLDGDGQPTDTRVPHRRRADFKTPVPKARKQGKKESQEALGFNEDKELSTEELQIKRTAELVNGIRALVDAWRKLPEEDCRTTPTTTALLRHWRTHDFQARRPFFCQIEAAEVAIWLAEVAPKMGKKTADLLEQLAAANEEANPGLDRVALKLATGAGKTTVMAMLIAWQAANHHASPGTRKYTDRFLVVTPGITVKDRLGVLQPNHPENYYAAFELVPPAYRQAVAGAKVHITNYHAFKRRESVPVAKQTRGLIEGRDGKMVTLETERQMLKRATDDLHQAKAVMVLNDEAHHCYREKQGTDDEPKDDAGDGGREKKQNQEAARLWINGIEALGRATNLLKVYDLSATPFFLKGSGYPEGTLFSWCVSDFSLMDAIECGIVKLPRIPVTDNSLGQEPDDDGTVMPVFRDLWEHIRRDMPSGKTSSKHSPDQLPPKLCAAIDQLYDHYKQTFEAWEGRRDGIPPCFIVVCNNTASSKLIYDYLSGWEKPGEGETTTRVEGHCPLFRNHDGYGEPLDRPVTILVDSDQLESGESDQLDGAFREAAAEEIERFRQEKVAQGASPAEVEKLADSDLLREAMNTVGKRGRLGEQIRCVVSVSMLTEGWDANNVTHILGVRAFGSQLISEQVIGRALRRMNYGLNDEGLFDVEYADVLGLRFTFAAEPVVAPPKPPVERTDVYAVSPERDDLAIEFPRVAGYRLELPEEELDATFTDESKLELTPAYVGSTITVTSGVVGRVNELSPDWLDETRESAILNQLTSAVMLRKFGAEGGQLYFKLKPIVRRWMDECLTLTGNVKLAQLLYAEIADAVAGRIERAVSRRFADERPVRVLLDPNGEVGSTRGLRFSTTKTDLWDTAGLGPPRCHLNFAVCDSDWEMEFCRVAELHPRVVRWVKNHQLGFDVPYTLDGKRRRYVPDFVLVLDSGLNLIVEVKGYRGEDAAVKAETMATQWVPGVNANGAFGTWVFAEFLEPFGMEEGVTDATNLFDTMIGSADARGSPSSAV